MGGRHDTPYRWILHERRVHRASNPDSLDSLIFKSPEEVAEWTRRRRWLIRAFGRLCWIGSPLLVLGLLWWWLFT